MSSLSEAKKKRKKSMMTVETSSQASTSSLEDGDGEGDKGTKTVKKQKKGESLRMKELKKDWTKLLDESRDHAGDSSDAEGKRKEWLAKCETIYDEYVTLTD